MQLHQIQPKQKNKTRKRIGQNSRAGTRKMQPIIREIVKRYPKLRGYRHNLKKGFVAAVNLSVLEREFKTGEKVTPKSLISKGIISKIKGRVPEVKILGKGKLTKKLIFSGVEMSASAKEKTK